MLFGKGSYGTVYINTDKSISKHVNLLSNNKLIDSNLKEICFYSMILSLYNEILNNTLTRFISLKTYIKPCNWIKLNQNIGIINMEYKGNVINIETEYSISEIFNFISYISELIFNLQVCGLSHGDIKPNNICYNSKTNTWSIIDFGSICFHTKNIHEYSKVRCTLFYIAPDELLDITYKKDADLWSFGVIIFEMYTKKYFLLELLHTLDASNETIQKFKNSIIHKNDTLIADLRSIYTRLKQDHIKIVINKWIKNQDIKDILMNLLTISNRKLPVSSISTARDRSEQSPPEGPKVPIRYHPEYKLIEYSNINIGLLYESRKDILKYMFSKLGPCYLFSHTVMMFDRYLLRKYNYNIKNGYAIIEACYNLSNCIILSEQPKVDNYEIILDILNTLDYKIFNLPPEEYIKDTIDYNKLLELYIKYPVCHDTVQQIADIYR